MKKPRYSKEFLKRLKAITSKRPRTVIQHILEHGFITTEELETKYGYKHAPRAARDVREQGIPLETFSVKNSQGKTIAAYRFADPSAIRRGTHAGRRAFSKEFKGLLLERSGSRCAICLARYEERYLQIDHRVPYEVAGDPRETDPDPDDFMLLCGSCNRAKSWSCEHCANWLRQKESALCQTCYWGSPESYRHVALAPIRRLDVTWANEEVEEYEQLRKSARAAATRMPDFVKRILRKHLH